MSFRKGKYINLEGRVDNNQNEVVDALRKFGASVQSLASVGKGAPDLLVGYRGGNFLFEVKNGQLPPSRQRLTKPQVEWHAAWRGAVFVVNSPEDAVKMLRTRAAIEGLLRKEWKWEGAR